MYMKSTFKIQSTVQIFDITLTNLDLFCFIIKPLQTDTMLQYPYKKVLN